MDLISRQAAIDAIWSHATNILESSDYDVFLQDIYKMAHRHIAEVIERLPSAQHERTGRWIPDNNFYYETRFVCSECKKSECVPTIGFTLQEPLWDYCPNCGARMDGERRADATFN